MSKTNQKNRQELLKQHQNDHTGLIGVQMTVVPRTSDLQTTLPMVQTVPMPVPIATSSSYSRMLIPSVAQMLMSQRRGSLKLIPDIQLGIPESTQDQEHEDDDDENQVVLQRQFDLPKPSLGFRIRSWFRRYIWRRPAPDWPAPMLRSKSVPQMAAPLETRQQKKNDFSNAGRGAHRRTRSRSLPDAVLRGRLRVQQMLKEGATELSASESEAEKETLAEKQERHRKQRRVRMERRKRWNKAKGREAPPNDLAPASSQGFDSILENGIDEETLAGGSKFASTRRMSMPNQDVEKKNVGSKPLMFFEHKRQRSRSVPDLSIMRRMHAPNAANVSSSSGDSENENYFRLYAKGVDMYS